MRLRPDPTRRRTDTRFDHYRGRVGRLYRDGREVGLVLVLTEPYGGELAGRLFWRAPRELLSLWTLIGDEFFESVVLDECADEELAAYDEGRFCHYGEALQVVWLDDDESARLRESEFDR